MAIRSPWKEGEIILEVDKGDFSWLENTNCIFWMLLLRNVDLESIYWGLALYNLVCCGFFNNQFLIFNLYYICCLFWHKLDFLNFYVIVDFSYQHQPFSYSLHLQGDSYTKNELSKHYIRISLQWLSLLVCSVVLSPANGFVTILLRSQKWRIDSLGPNECSILIQAIYEVLQIGRKRNESWKMCIQSWLKIWIWVLQNGSQVY